MRHVQFWSCLLAADGIDRHNPGAFGNVLCPIDFSEASTAALEQALRVVHETKGRLTLMHVPPNLDPMSRYAYHVGGADDPRTAAQGGRGEREIGRDDDDCGLNGDCVSEIESMLKETRSRPRCRAIVCAADALSGSGLSQDEKNNAYRNC